MLVNPVMDPVIGMTHIVKTGIGVNVNHNKIHFFVKSRWENDKIRGWEVDLQLLHALCTAINKALLHVLLAWSIYKDNNCKVRCDYRRRRIVIVSVR